jgi:cell filamentation protein
MFDPFGDYARAGYLRNIDGLKDLDEVKLQEHAFFLANVEDALALLRKRRGHLQYHDLLNVHRILFDGFYPWAGKDRHQLGVGGSSERATASTSRHRSAANWPSSTGCGSATIARRCAGNPGPF